MSAPESRNALFFDRTRPPVDSDDGGESDYETTPADLKRQMAYLQKQSQSYQQRPLLPVSFINSKNRQRQIEAYQRTVLRFLLPDNQTIQANFCSNESMSDIFLFIDSILLKKIDYDLCFFLKEKLSRDKTKSLLDAGFSPKSNIILSLKEPVTNLFALFSAELLKQSTFDEADNVSDEWLSVNTVYEPYDPIMAPNGMVVQNQQTADVSGVDEQPSRSRPPVKGMPKWLKR